MKNMNKKTVIFKTVDGHDVIIGFDSPSIEPVETNKIVSEAIKEADEFKAAEAKKAEYSDAVREMSELQKKYKKNEKVSRSDQEKWNHLLGKMAVRQDELKPLAIELAEKIVELRQEHAVYFEPRKGEVIVDASKVDGLREDIKGKADGTLITIDGATIEDNRGKSFYRKSGGKWGRTQIVKLGDKIPGDAVIEPSETQAAEIEIDRVAALTDSARSIERDNAMEDAMNQAQGMRSELEIKSDTGALKKSQAWYKTEVAKVEGLYG